MKALGHLMVQCSTKTQVHNTRELKRNILSVMLCPNYTKPSMPHPRD
jgi:hypothetical protein